MMSGSNTMSTTVESIYVRLITLELASIAVKYQGLTTSPFQERNASLLLFIIATFCHAIALTTKITWLTAKLFHVSGVAACEALLWVLVVELMWCILINVLMLLVMALIFNCNYIGELLVLETFSTCGQEHSDNTYQMVDLGAQEGNAFHSLLCCCYTRRRFLLQHFGPTYSLLLASTRVQHGQLLQRSMEF